MNKIRVFICYKKYLSREENGQTFVQKNTEATILHEILQRSGRYDSWVDSQRIVAGMAWETDIYRNLVASDVMIVLLGPGTSASPWVRREIALAKALGLSMVPLGFDVSSAEAASEARELEISDLQYDITRNIAHDRAAALLAELEEALSRAAEQTKRTQLVSLKGLWDRQRSTVKVAAYHKSRASYRLSADHSHITLHICSGDVAEVRDIDVLVNSENNFMQMARFFERATVSSKLRDAGSYYTKDGRHRDVIQQELDQVVELRGRPVRPAEVFATSAGGPLSDLATINRARVILHVAAVQAVEATNGVVPYSQPRQISAAVRSAMSEMARINALDGVFAPPGTEQRADQERRAAHGQGQLRSILFPLLGTGQGGASVPEVIEPMLKGLADFLAQADNATFVADLRDIYLSAYTEVDVATLKTALDERLKPAEA